MSLPHCPSSLLILVLERSWCGDNFFLLSLAAHPAQDCSLLEAHAAYLQGLRREWDRAPECGRLQEGETSLLLGTQSRQQPSGVKLKRDPALAREGPGCGLFVPYF